ncbi:MAG: hypothetical protein OHK0046_16330 [Anaerolineae bacterium]
MPNKRRLMEHYSTIVARAIYQVMRDHAGMTPAVVDHLHYGAVDIHPKHLAVWMMFQDGNDLHHAQNSGYCHRLRAELKQALLEQGYPREALNHIHIGFESKAEVDKVGAWNYFK